MKFGKIALLLNDKTKMPQFPPFYGDKSKSRRPQQGLQSVPEFIGELSLADTPMYPTLLFGNDQ